MAVFNKKIFSVIIPVYNAQYTIDRCLASLISNKDYIKEIILVNDGTTDKTFDIAEKYDYIFDNIIVIDNDTGHKGPGPARKCGILAATSEWITFLDADDCLTPSCMDYVRKAIRHAHKDTVLLHTKSIFYESGYFVQDDIGYVDLSCGGNYYKREYLIEHNLLPHDELFMAEDEYFNEVVIRYIDLCDTSGKAVISYFDYPTYEVHHDVETIGNSFALGNWENYTVKYHLLEKMLFVDAFIAYEDQIEDLKRIYMDNYIFCFYLMLGAYSDRRKRKKYKKELISFQLALGYLHETFYAGKEDLISRYRELIEQDDNDILEAAFASCGGPFELYLNFEKFLTEEIL